MFFLPARVLWLRVRLLVFLEPASGRHSQVCNRNIHMENMEVLVGQRLDIRAILEDHKYYSTTT